MDKKEKEKLQAAIREAMQSKDPHAQALWKEIAPNGKEPTVDEFLNFCAEKLHRKRKGD